MADRRVRRQRRRDPRRRLAYRKAEKVSDKRARALIQIVMVILIIACVLYLELGDR